MDKKKEQYIPEDHPWEYEEGNCELTELYEGIYRMAVKLADEQRGKHGLNKKETQLLIKEHIEVMKDIAKYDRMATVVKEGK